MPEILLSGKRVLICLEISFKMSANSLDSHWIQSISLIKQERVVVLLDCIVVFLCVAFQSQIILSRVLFQWQFHYTFMSLHWQSILHNKLFPGSTCANTLSILIQDNFHFIQRTCNQNPQLLFSLYCYYMFCSFCIESLNGKGKKWNCEIFF